MDLNTVGELISLRDRADLAKWTQRSAWLGSAWLAGGSWLFSEPQNDTNRLLDLSTMGWPAVTLDETGVSIAATCTIATLFNRAWPPDLTSFAVVEPSCRALLGSFKVWNVATVGGNISLALPAAPMVALATALEGQLLIWTAEGDDRRVAAERFVLGASRTVLRPGELVRAVELPMRALRRRTATRRASLTDGGRSAAYLIGTRDGEGFALTVTAATPRPYRLALAPDITAAALRQHLDDLLPLDAYYDDLHGRPAWRRHMTRRLAEEIRNELVGT